MLVNTHCHSDHMGGNAAVASAFGCPIAIPEGEAPLIAAWDTRALLLDYADQRAERFSAGALLRAGDKHVWGDLEWQLLAAPGHDMGALIFYNPEHGLLISGDALWENGFGFVMPTQIDPAALPATRATLDLIASLEVRLLIPGHGEPFVEVDAALERAYGRLAAFERDPDRLARHALKVLLAFVLLDRRRLSVQQMPDYVQRIGIFRDFNARFFQWPPAKLAEWLIAELIRAGAAGVVNGELQPLQRSAA